MVSFYPGCRQQPQGLQAGAGNVSPDSQQGSPQPGPHPGHHHLVPDAAQMQQLHSQQSYYGNFAAAAAANNHHYHQAAVNQQSYPEPGHDMATLWPHHQAAYLLQQQQVYQHQQAHFQAMQGPGLHSWGQSTGDMVQNFQQQQQQQQQHSADSGVCSAEPSPSMSAGGTHIRSPSVSPTGSIGVNANNGPNQNRQPGSGKGPYEWMKRTAAPAQPCPALPGTSGTPPAAAAAPAADEDDTGKTRTKDKYRVVYSEFQRLELEKEFYCSKYITIKRKGELAAGLDLSERQVKIWFQNRRAKERKQRKKRGEMERQTTEPAVSHPPVGAMAALNIGMGNMLGGLMGPQGPQHPHHPHHLFPPHM